MEDEYGGGFSWAKLLAWIFGLIILLAVVYILYVNVQNNAYSKGYFEGALAPGIKGAIPYAIVNKTTNQTEYKSITFEELKQIWCKQ